MENHTNTLPVGSRLKGHAMLYEIIEVLGQGGFGITYKAELLIEGSLGMTRSGAVFAIKEFFISDINLRDGETVTGTGSRKFTDTLHKFERESKLLSTLSHPGICHVQDAFRANGTAYYVMDFYPGGSLAALISRTRGGALSEMQTLDYIHEIGSALAYLHRQGMAHLDLKPQNIMLKADGHPVLIDFGISKRFDDDGQFRSSDTMGGCTPGYAPLEQANYTKGDGDPHLMDIYALGATLYKMLTGQTPPKAPEVLNNGLPLDELRRRGVSEQVIAVIVKAMQPIKRDRFKSVEAMMAALPGGDEVGEVTVVDVKPQTNQTNRTNQTNQNAPIDPISPISPIDPISPISPAGPEDPANSIDSPAPSEKPLPLTAIIIAAIVALGIIGYFLIPKGSDNTPEAIALADSTISAEEALPQPMVVTEETPDLSQTPAPAEQQRQREEEARKQREEQERLAEQQRQREEETRKQREEQERLAKQQRQREEEEKPLAEINEYGHGHISPRNIDLCTMRDGKVIYFTQSEWSSVPSSEKSQYTKKGIYVSGNGRSFLLALNDNGKSITWDEATNRYGSSMPTEEQGRVLANNMKAIKSAIQAFGGSGVFYFWTRSEIDSSNAWEVSVAKGIAPYTKNGPSRVRAVAPVPASAR